MHECGHSMLGFVRHSPDAARASWLPRRDQEQLRAASGGIQASERRLEDTQRALSEAPSRESRPSSRADATPAPPSPRLCFALMPDALSLPKPPCPLQTVPSAMARGLGSTGSLRAVVSQAPRATSPLRRGQEQGGLTGERFPVGHPWASDPAGLPVCGQACCERDEVTGRLEEARRGRGSERVHAGPRR